MCENDLALMRQMNELDLEYSVTHSHLLRIEGTRRTAPVGVGFFCGARRCLSSPSARAGPCGRSRCALVAYAAQISGPMYATDITHIPTWCGLIYLFAVMNRYSRHAPDGRLSYGVRPTNTRRSRKSLKFSPQKYSLSGVQGRQATGMKR